MSDPQRNHFAANAIGAIAGRRAEVEAWIDEIERGQWQYSTSLAMHRVWWVLTERNLSGGWRGDEPDAAGRVALAARLRTFVAALPGLERGTVAVDPAWDEDLLPAGWRIDLEDGSSWPKGREERPRR